MAEHKKRRLEQDPDFLTEYIKGSFVADVEETMEEEGISKAQLARRLDRSRQYVSKVLNEEDLNNFTIDSIAKIAVALQRDVVLRLKRYDEIVEIVPFADWKRSKVTFGKSLGNIKCAIHDLFETQRVSRLTESTGRGCWTIETRVPAPDYGIYEDESTPEVEEHTSQSNATA